VRTGVVEAYDAFKQALESFVDESERGNTDVFQSPPGILWANVGTEKFRGVPSTRRQEMIWAYLGKELSEDVLHYCWGVHCMDTSEYREASIARRSASETLRLFVEGTDADD
jgi:stress-induced morphogen